MSTIIKITAPTGVTEFTMTNIDFSESRDKAALRVGREIVDAIYNGSEK